MDLPAILNVATTTAVVGGVIFAAWQIRVATRARETQIALQLVEMLQTRNLMEGLSALHDVPEGLGWTALASALGDNWSSVFTLINALDGLGILVYRREVSPRVADEFFHHAISEVWTRSRAAIFERRETVGRETSFQFLEWLAESQAAYRERLPHRRRKAYPLVQEGSAVASRGPRR